MPRGRPRKMDPEDALSKALVLFWKQGYAGTSMNDISAATGMAKPGLYANFGDKDALFIKSLERYVAKYGEPVHTAFQLGAGTFKEDLTTYLNTLANGMTLNDHPHGCMCVMASFDFGETSDPVGVRLAELTAKGGEALADRLQKAVADGELRADADLDRLQLFLNGQIVAIASLARTGAERGQLQVIIDMAIDSLPWTQQQH
ncbi:TetR/AcrR family transcriptional regulator [Tropicibacter sp. R15_0]|uniref:TetR/AcrR family transcriptional regulator n=1 Tax=Tropicibacter sp. R15_0 TaxID=2821101 RepID=UPI001ADA95F6|nr:TetR/AcrR family transcriptional regulator [Tropicibacter sp. R15_0]MBO9466086.1 TetR/AcrR family transcriptional regulator [Tropicibacter sp. R15_0]